MSDESPIIMYTSHFCPHSLAFERYFASKGIPVELRNIDGNVENRGKVMELNNGNASVPTLLFPDGSQLTEPSFSQLRQKLNIESKGLVDRIKELFS